MANLSNNVKTAFLKGLEALGKTASSLSDAASQKLNEMNLETRRREVLTQIPKCVMQLWKDGVELPAPLTSLLEELTELENKLAAMRPKQETAPVQEEAAEEIQFDEPAEEIADDSEEVFEEEAAAPEQTACECSAEGQAEDVCCNDAEAATEDNAE